MAAASEGPGDRATALTTNPAADGDGAATGAPSAAAADDAAATGPHPAVAAAWAALDGAGIRWALLRGAGDGAGGGDIDLLVDPRDGPALDAALTSAGYVRLAAIGHGGHRFYRTYDEATDRWLTLDVLTELAYGPGGWLRSPGVAEAALERRTPTKDGMGLAPDDAFFALLLHDALDRGDSPPDHRRALDALAGPIADAGAAAGADAAVDVGPIARRIDAIGGAGTAARLAALVAAGQVDRAVADGRRLGARWARSEATDAVPRRIRHAVLRRLRKPHTALRRRGIDVAVLGPDGAGKSTLAASLATALPVPTRTLYLGLYGSGLGEAHRFGGVRRIARLWRGWTAGLWHRLRGRLVVYDRHALDVLVAPTRTSRKARLRRWVLRHAIPDPALVLILDAPAELLFARKGEHDIPTLEAQRRGYRALLGQVKGAELIDATRDAEAVRRDAIARTWRRMAGGGHG